MKATLFKELNHKKKYDCCISVSLFKMKNGGYKRVEIYVNMFLAWSKFIPKSSFIRLYIDESALFISNFEKILEANIPLEIYLFKDERFLLEDGIHHDGTFGSMARYLAFFDKDLDVDYIWTTDMDQIKIDIRAHYLTAMKKNEVDVLYRSEACYANAWIPSEVDYPIINDRLILSKNIKVSKRIFDKFLTDVYEGKYTELKENILKQRKRLQGQIIHHFPYGFDEYYTNNILYKQINKYTRLIYYSISLTTIGKRYPGILKNFNKIEENEKKLWNNFHPDLNLKQKKEFEKARKEIEIQKERFKDSYRLNKCLQDFDLFKDKLDINEKFSTVLLI
jgi:hypothetical protein